MRWSFYHASAAHDKNGCWNSIIFSFCCDSCVSGKRLLFVHFVDLLVKVFSIIFFTVFCISTFQHGRLCLCFQHVLIECVSLHCCHRDLLGIHHGASVVCHPLNLCRLRWRLLDYRPKRLQRLWQMPNNGSASFDITSVNLEYKLILPHRFDLDGVLACIVLLTVHNRLASLHIQLTQS